ncbi:MAG: hypothetical protein IKZ82_04355, partial [Clostridia bacterium]|nr:hypothetical protein [Clostridia bacterium]
MAENNDIMNGSTTKMNRPDARSRAASAGGDTATYDRSSEKENESGKKASKRAFVRRKRPHSTLLAILFTAIKVFIIVGIVGAFAVLGLFLGIAK